MKGRPRSFDDDAEAHRWAHGIDRARKKKKPKAKSGQPQLSPLTDPPSNVEVIRKPRKEKPVVVEDEEPARTADRRTDAIARRSAERPNGRMRSVTDRWR